MRNLLLLIALLTSYNLFAQNKQATLYLRNGEVLKGLARMKADQTVKFRKDKESEPVIYNFRTLKGLKINTTLTKREDVILLGSFTTYNKDFYTFQYKMIKKKRYTTKPKLLRLLVDGKMALFSEVSAGAPRMNSSGTAMGGTAGAPVERFYICNEDKDFVTYFLTDGGGIEKSFKKAALVVFKDYPKIADRIKDKTYKRRDIVEMFEDFNRIYGNSK
ncbi:hypothetical protein [Marinifilum fragile]|uniref:hypothetical protein n=1 Tax=Marinifilum fragile TaxID=570161 RepID=UPI002AA6E687|nr:hypothetical protein [Marinifilum fragile]